MENSSHKKSLLNSDFYRMEEVGHTLIKFLPEEIKELNKMKNIIDLITPYHYFINVLGLSDKNFEWKTQTFTLPKLFNDYKHLMTEKQIKQLKTNNMEDNKEITYKGLATIDPTVYRTMEVIDNQSFKQNECYVSKTHPKDFATSVSRIYAQAHVILQSSKIKQKLLEKLSTDQTITITLKELEEIISWKNIKYQ